MVSGSPFENWGTACPSDSHYLQEFIQGEPRSATFRDSNHLGTFRQLIGTPWLHAKPFQYAGNVSLEITDHSVANRDSLIANRHSNDLRDGKKIAISNQQSAISQRGLEGIYLLNIAACLQLRGIWGIDWIETPSGPYLLEVNPRYTAAHELIHRPGGKGIYYAPHRIRFQQFGFSPPHFADIPEPGTTIEAGEPVLTILVDGSSPEESEAKLRARAEELDRLFVEQR